ncbi:hypothetical protein [Prosthecobacter sp.]|uniref:hypothetical protein n=1 Tax=Prosthecobacter sp. TaxID=1965333 RepID=UPI002AB9B4AD|nr:hypothetical protein [Prosthecobacter sp.]MDZ4405066.1 hypothetical protein [Prosthecobacter sp.]
MDHTCPHRYAQRCRRVIPFAVAPQLDHVIANLELMPLRMNIGKRAAMGERQQALARQLRSAGLF